MSYTTIDNMTRDSLRDYLISEGFVVVKDTVDELLFQNPSADWFFGFERKLYSDSAFDIQAEAWLLNVFSSYDNTKTFYQQPGGLTNLDGTSQENQVPSIPFNRDMANKAFINVTSLRIILVVRFGAYYFSYYIGKMNSYSGSTNYQDPFICAGSCGYNLRQYNPANVRDSDFICGVSGYDGDSAWFKDFNGNWQQYESNNGANDYVLNNFALYPFIRSTANMTKNIDGSYTLFPSIVMGGLTTGDKWFYGELDIYRVSGFNNNAENTFTIGAENYICFPIQQTIVDGGQFFAIKTS